MADEREYFYRFEDQRYSVADEWGDHCYTSHEVKLLVFPLISRTKCGAWIGLNYTRHPRLPSEWSKTCMTGKRFVNLEATKKFALPTIDEARESYLKRKLRQIFIYEARIAGAKKHLEAMDSYLRTLPTNLLVNQNIPY